MVLVPLTDTINVLPTDTTNAFCSTGGPSANHPSDEPWCSPEGTGGVAGGHDEVQASGEAVNAGSGMHQTGADGGRSC
jgi:hypothetical protein